MGDWPPKVYKSKSTNKVASISALLASAFGDTIIFFKLYCQ